jgi:hypothetical protein
VHAPAAVAAANAAASEKRAEAAEAAAVTAGQGVAAAAASQNATASAIASVAETEARLRARAEAAEGALAAAQAEAASARDEQSIERKGLLSELHALHLQASKLDEQVRLGQQALLVEEQKRQAVLGEREAEQRQATQLRAQLDDSHRMLMTTDDH